MPNQKLRFAILVATLGYFVDVYDIILFSAVRVPSLQSLGLTATQITDTGIFLINIQLLGMLIGGLLWGIWGDKKGRLAPLFGSILLYSGATLANAFVSSVESYALLRFLAGCGLAGELGAGITLVSELMPPHKRGYGTMLIVIAGALGGVAGGLIGNFFAWQTAYIIGGLGGLVLLLLRFRVGESALFTHIQHQHHIPKGSLRHLLQSKALALKYLLCLLVGMPFWIFIGIFMALAPELGRALQVNTPITAGLAIVTFCLGLAFGELSSAFVSQRLRSRRKAVSLYLTILLLAVISFLSCKTMSSTAFYSFCALLGFGSGSWAIFNMISAEQFGTNLRATVTTSLPNLVRGMGVPFAFILTFLKPYLGITGALAVISLSSILLAFVAIYVLKETYARDLNFIDGESASI